MKAKNLLLVLGIVIFVFSASEIQAQKRVHVKKSKKSSYHSNIPRSKVRFKHNKRHVNSFRKLPRASISIKHKGVRFHYHGGNFYRHYAGEYMCVIPPLGIRINVLPRGYSTFIIDNRAYYYIDGIYYSKRRSGRLYEVVEAPIGAIIHHLPMSAERIQINNKSFFECNLAVYSKIRSSQGHAYKVVGHLESYGNHY